MDASALVAALDVHDAEHATVRTTLAALLESSRRAEIVLASHSEALTSAALTLSGRPEAAERLALLSGALDIEVLQPDLLADAESVRLTAADHGIDLTLGQAITVEVARRRRSARVLSVDTVYAQVGLRLAGVAAE